MGPRLEEIGLFDWRLVNFLRRLGPLVVGEFVRRLDVNAAGVKGTRCDFVRQESPSFSVVQATDRCLLVYFQ